MYYVKATEEDYVRAYAMMKDATRDYLDATLATLDIEENEFANLFRSVGEVFVAKQDEVMTGFYWIERRDEVLHIHGIILDEPYRHQGHGRAMMSTIEKTHAGEVKDIELGVKTNNTPAINLYKSLGYKVVKTHEAIGFYIMRKRIKQT